MVNIGSRWYVHRHLLKKNKHHTKDLQEYYNEISNVLDYRILEECLGSELHGKEIFWSDKLRPLFWGRKPGKSWRWSDYAPSVIERLNIDRRTKANRLFSEIDRLHGNEVVELYEAGLTTEQIPKEIPVSYSYVLRILKHRKIPFRTKKDYLGVPYLKEKSENELREEILEHRSLNRPWKDIAERWGCGTTTVRDLAKKLGVLSVKPPLPIAKWSDESLKEEILRLEAKGLASGEIASHLGIGRSTLWRRLYKLFPDRYRVKLKPLE